jgi:hypothetical protein
MRIYPPIPNDAQTGLLLFGAYFKGENDGRFLHDAGLTCTVIDNQQHLLDAMAPDYPDSWEFICADAFDYAQATDRTWDVVSVDPSSPEEPRTLRWADTFRKLANMMTIVGCRTADAGRFGPEWAHFSGRPLDEQQPWSWMIWQKEVVKL